MLLLSLTMQGVGQHDSYRCQWYLNRAPPTNSSRHLALLRELRVPAPFDKNPCTKPYKKA